MLKQAAINLNIRHILNHNLNRLVVLIWVVRICFKTMQISLKTLEQIASLLKKSSLNLQQLIVQQSGI